MRKLILIFLLSFFYNNIYSQSYLYTLYMYDSYGDGWNGNYFQLHDSNGNLDHSVTLSWGYSGSVNIYINNDNYSITCSGGYWQSEVSWFLYNSYGQLILSGGAPYSNSGYFANGYFSPQVINSISPNTGVPSQTLSVNISGSGFSQFSGTVPDFRFNQWSGTNIIDGNSSSISGNNLYGDITLPCDAAGYYDVEIFDNSTGAWINSPNLFFVDSSISQVTCLEQTSTAQGDFLSVEISGNFAYNTPYSTNPVIKFSQFSGTNSFYPITDSVNECKLYGHIDVSYSQNLGSYDLEVFDNYSSPVFSDIIYDALFVHPYSIPTIDSINPDYALTSTSLAVHIRGTNINYGNLCQKNPTFKISKFNQFSGTNYEIFSTNTSFNGKDLYGTLDVPSNTPIGLYDVSVFNYKDSSWLVLPSSFEVISNNLVYGCTDSTALNYDSNANWDDGTCSYCDLSNVITIQNPTDSITCNGFGLVNSTSSYSISSYQWENSSGLTVSSSNYAFGLCNGMYYLTVTDIIGCIIVDTLAIGQISGCTDSTYYEFNLYANIDDGSCITQIIYGCTDSLSYNYNSNANFDDGNCCYLSGCLDSTALNFNPYACYADNSTCISAIYGCTDPIASNYNPSANINDGTCAPYLYGCTDSLAFNFDAIANTNDGSCLYCDLTNSFFTIINTSGNCDGLILSTPTSSYSPISYSWSTGDTINNITNLCPGLYILTISDSVGCQVVDSVIMNVVLGCTDSTAENFDPLATYNDGSCWYCNVTPLDSSVFYYTGAMQSFTVPLGVTSVTIEAYGAQGGGDNGSAGGLGAYMSGEFTVNPGDQLQILVGQEGGIDLSGAPNSAGGGGGSYVVDNLNNPMIIAGGGGGTNGSPVSGGRHASISNYGNNGYSPSNPTNFGLGGFPGYGATNSTNEPCAGNGGGFYTDGENINSCCYDVSVGIAFLNGGHAALNGGCGTNSPGGFGGGGAGGYDGCGGGGGYSGGGANYHYGGNGGGGGSYNSGSNQYNTEQAGQGNGLVIIYYGHIIASSGCTDPNADNYDSLALCDDGSCYTCDLNYSSVSYNNTTGNCDGSIYFVADTSYGPVTYVWQLDGSVFDSTVSSFNVQTQFGLCSGTYTVTATDTNGCSFTENIYIGTSCVDSLQITISACDFFVWDGVTYDSTGIFTNTYSNIGGCDSIVTLDLTINYSYSSTYIITTCLGYDWDGVTYDSTGTYTNVYTDVNGCDSTVTLDLTISYLLGCTDSTAINFDSLACLDDGSCIYCVYGCTDPTALNYDANATCDDGSCTYNCTSPKPTGLYAYDVIDTRAKIGWDNMNEPNCMVWKYFVRYREVGTSQWTTKSAGVGNGLCNFGLNTVTKQLLNLTPSTTYEFRMKAFYCGGTSSNYSTPVQFTTADVCPDMTNLTTTTFNGNQAKVRFNWDTTGAYTFARILLRVDTAGSAWQTAGGFGVYYPTLFVNKFGLTPGESYRAQGRTFCDSNITAYRSPTWTVPIFWTQPGSIKEGGGLSINNLDIYPNPSRDVFNISFSSEEKQDLRIRILSVVGAEVYREDRENFIGEYTKQVSLDNYGKGIYLLEIETNKGIINKKLILQ